jgi:DNA-binding response OmpR family regulator
MKTILIVDDQFEVRELVKVTLRTGGYNLLEADNGRAALEEAGREHPDLVLLDVMMPGDIDGMEVARRLKADQETRDITIVMLTAKGQKMDQEAGLAAGADDYFVKPFSPLELIRKVESLLA